MTSNSLTGHFLENHPRESARVLEQFGKDELVAYLDKLPVNVSANIIRYFVPALAVACLDEMQESGKLLEHLGTDSAARLLRKMNSGLRNRLINSTSTLFASRIKSILRFPSGTVGQYLSPNVFMATSGMSVQKVLDAVREAAGDLHTDIFIINDNQQLVGIVDIKELVTVDPDMNVTRIMHKPDVVLNARMDLQRVADLQKWQYKEIIPVVDHQNIFIGVLKRSVMQEARESEEGLQQEDETVVETLMEVVELFWDICTNLVIPRSDTVRQGRKHD